MRVVFVSDTHNQHDRVEVPDGDVLVHCGDATTYGTPEELVAFCDWLGAQPHRRKLYVPGNHDLLFRDNPAVARSIVLDAGESVGILFEAEVRIDGVKFYGSPYSPRYRSHRWAFHYERHHGAGVWSRIPEDADVVITHGPPLGILDMTCERFGAYNAGCPDLLKRIIDVSPAVHAFGHIHEGHGEWVLKHQDVGNTRFVNAAICDETYEPVNKPIVVEL